MVLRQEDFGRGNPASPEDEWFELIFRLPRSLRLWRSLTDLTERHSRCRFNFWSRFFEQFGCCKVKPIGDQIAGKYFALRVVKRHRIIECLTGKSHFVFRGR